MPKAGRYRIARKIADGGMAEIFLGTQHGAEGFERPVVLKRILAPLVADPQFRNMLIDEAHVAMGLNHSNIVQVLDLGHVRGRYFLVLELVDGWDLSQVMARAETARFPVPPEILLYITAEVCRALAYAHARTRDGKPLGIVHRDVSPQNVLVSEQGEVKLTDFGIAKAMGRREQTSQGVIKGKLAFMSPEQASGHPLDHRSDLFSVGTMLYLFFTKRKPFEAPTDLESIMRVRECRFIPPEQHVPSLDPALVQILRRAMRGAPAERYQSAEQMLLDLENVQRTVFRPSGQTELKQWLAELQKRDGSPTTSKAVPAQPGTPPTEDFDVGEGAEVVFDDSNLIEVSAVLREGSAASSPSALPPLPVAPPPLPPPKQAAEAETKAVSHSELAPQQNASPSARSESHTAADKPAPSAHPAATGPTGGFSLRRIAFVAAALATFIAVTVWLGRAPSPPPPAPVARKPAVATAKPPRPAPAKLDASSPADTGAIDSQAAPASAQAEPPASDEEETLLEHAEPDDSKRVLGENEGVAETKAAANAPIAAISVRIVSTPPGAVIGIGKRVFGRAPMNLRFRQGITFELTFVKKGYQTTSKRFTVTGKKNQLVKATLQKKPEPKKPPKKSFLRRLFGH
jgi:serine/threonine-protein kinase